MKRTYKQDSSNLPKENGPSWDNSVFDINVTDRAGTAQQWYQVISHLDIVRRYEVKLFVELGMFLGGMLVHLLPHLILNEDFYYIGFEMDASIVHPKLIEYSKTNSRCQIITEDMWKHEEYVAERIRNQDGRAYVFCDGGDKPRELETFQAHLRYGDIIAVHDYFDGLRGEILDTDLAKLPLTVVPLDGDWRRKDLGLPTFIKI